MIRRRGIITDGSSQYLQSEQSYPTASVPKLVLPSVEDFNTRLRHYEAILNPSVINESVKSATGALLPVSAGRVNVLTQYIARKWVLKLYLWDPVGQLLWGHRIGARLSMYFIATD